jgi:hypothetical protein
MRCSGGHSVWAFLISWPLIASEIPIEKINLEPTEEISRADFYIAKPSANPVAVLVLCPGFNGNGRSLVLQPAWVAFAKEHRLGMIGLSLATEGEKVRQGEGYYYPKRGSGEMVLKVVKNNFGRELPLLLYGFSGGAHFASGFAEWRPECVLGWCAYSAAWWDGPKAASTMPPGIVACGEHDAARYGASLHYFHLGRSLGKPWVWVSLKDVGHDPSPLLDTFARSFFGALLTHKKEAGNWYDVATFLPVERQMVNEFPSLAAWLPDPTLVDAWRKVHNP